MAHDFATVGVAETSPVVGAAQVARLPHAATPSFRYKWHPLRWQFFPDTDEWLPLLGTLQQDLGVSGIDKGGDDTYARVELDRRSWTLLPWDCVPPGTPGGKYIKAYPCKGGIYHCSVWEHPRAIGVVEAEVVAGGRHEAARPNCDRTAARTRAASLKKRATCGSIFANSWRRMQCSTSPQTCEKVSAPTLADADFSVCAARATVSH